MEKSLVYLQRRKTNESVEAELWDDITDGHVALWRTTWLPLFEQAMQRLKKDCVPKRNWPQDLHWDWDKKADWSRGLLSILRFAITCDGRLQGLMLVNLTKLTARLPTQSGKDIVYLEFVSTAPWNRPELTDEPVFHGVGLNMVRAAIEVSIAEGFRGRIGLHSLPQAARFYRERCGLTDLGPDASCYGLPYFEMTESQAAAFRASGGNR